MSRTTDGLRREFRRGGRDFVLNRCIASSLIAPALRWRLLRAIGMNVRHSYVQARCFFGARNVSIGVETFINYECFFDGSAPIAIGDRVRVGMRCTFVTGSHEIGDPQQRAGRERAAPISVEDGAWIGAGATILPGVTIGHGAIVAAGAVVTRSVAPLQTVSGVPARSHRDG
ncbi:DapH/DapD/GlmU-related protein [Curtobacterium sp. MCLR17_036]|uniref:acyltransferase n=1 Tax=Curtobacterium sp. MCLR17_036 TaxID=2175620 RepID=UPI000DA76D8F|nr:DapH/DapD/GlmU-related protein [Curtobacterium sp. MCLR17_036]WIE65410.1 DapH/DapD/GlmU-related protein [Curtobacterium sp. MCLR17_036]